MPVIGRGSIGCLFKKDCEVMCRNESVLLCRFNERVDTARVKKVTDTPENDKN